MLPTKMSSLQIKDFVKNITFLSNVLSQSVQQGTKEDKIWRMMNAGECDTAHETFNRQFDALFGEDCPDSSGRLLHIRRGKLGMGLVTLYLSQIVLRPLSYLSAACSLMLPLTRLLPYVYLPDRSTAYTGLTSAVAAISILSSYYIDLTRLHLLTLCLPSYSISLSHIYLIILQSPATSHSQYS
jgi:hypothetical protein